VGGVARLRGLPENPRHEIRIALAGPYVSLLLALTGFGLGYLTALGGMGLLTAVLIWFASINTALLLFNLLPSFPMDGGRVLRGWLSQKKGPLEATRIASQLGKYMAVAFIVLGLLGPASGSLAVIGLFIFLSAGSEYRMMQMKTWQDQSFGQAGNRFDPGFEASPPPYASKARTATPSGLWGDMRITAVDLFQEICSACKR
jgi:Zn-dependent protease